MNILLILFVIVINYDALFSKPPLLLLFLLMISFGLAFEFQPIIVTPDNITINIVMQYNFQSAER
jgi:hypothetical protein